MVTNVRRWSLGIAVASMMLSTLPASANDAEGVVHLSNQQSAGVIRISDHSSRVSAIVRGQTPSDDAFSAVAPPVPIDPSAYNPQPLETFTEGEVSVEEASFVDCNEGACPNGEYQEGYTYENCPNCQQGAPCRSCQTGYPRYSIGHCMTGCNNNKFADFLRSQGAMYRARNRYSSSILESSIEADCQEKHEWMRCKFGYFVPTGYGGKGCPPIGHYSMVYPVNPNHFDQRDGQVYAAQGYGGPVSVPLAPVVNHTYNYGWGIPSSRLTPVSHPIPQQ